MSQRLFYPLSVGLVAASLCFTMAGCAEKKSESSGLPSRGTDPIVDVGYLFAECNRIEIPQASLKGQISTYYSNGQILHSYLYANFTQFPSSVLTSTATLQAYRWSERVNGQPQTNSVPVTMYFTQKGTGIVSNPSGTNVISKNYLDALIKQYNLKFAGITTANFFERHYVVLTGMDLEWDAASFVLSNNGAETGRGSVLLPAFYSNPNIYAKANASTALQSLHPNAAYMNSNASENDYYRMTEQICSSFFGTVRSPSSVAGEIEPEATGFFSKLMQTLNHWLESIRSLFQNSINNLRLGRVR